jgi:hypothetical protein
MNGVPTLQSYGFFILYSASSPKARRDQSKPVRFIPQISTGFSSAEARMPLSLTRARPREPQAAFTGPARLPSRCLGGISHFATMQNRDFSRIGMGDDECSPAREVPLDARMETIRVKFRFTCQMV